MNNELGPHILTAIHRKLTKNGERQLISMFDDQFLQVCEYAPTKIEAVS
jgi:transcriptional accessory protein Tex/SPT6